MAAWGSLIAVDLNDGFSEVSLWQSCLSFATLK